jgi:ABC-2 type transport system permease protein
MVLARDSEPPLLVVGRRRSTATHVREIWSYRELLGSLIHKELKVRYKNSILGFLWSMVQPLFMLAVYAFAFSVLGAGFANFAIWLMCGLLVWNFVSTSLQTSTKAVTTNSHLVSKVRFPRAILPLASVGAALVHLGMQLLAFAVVLVVLRHSIDVEFLWLLPLAALTAMIVCATLALLLAALNVYARDTEHLLDLAVLAWFWLTPILYQYARVVEWLETRDLPGWLALLNPFTSMVIVFQRAIYGSTTAGDTVLLPDDGPLWYLQNLAIVGGISLVMLVLALRIFDRAEANFAEAL